MVKKKMGWLTSSVVGPIDRLFPQRGTRNSLLMLYAGFGDFTRKGELHKDAQRFLIEAEKIAADYKVEQGEFEDLIKKLEKTPDMDLITALMGTLSYKFSGKKRFKKVGIIPDEHLALIGMNLIRYFFTRMCEMADEAELIISGSLYRLWRTGRGLQGLFTKDFSDDIGKIGKIKRVEAGPTSEARTLKYLMTELRRGKLLGGINVKDCRNYIIEMCKSFTTPADSLAAVRTLGKKKFTVHVKDPITGKIVAKKMPFDFVRFLVGFNEFTKFTKRVRNPQLKRKLQVFTAQLLYVFFIRFAYHFKMAEFTRKSPNFIDVRHVKIGLRGLFGVSFEQLVGDKVTFGVKSTTKHKHFAKQDVRLDKLAKKRAKVPAGRKSRAPSPGAVAAA